MIKKHLGEYFTIDKFDLKWFKNKKLSDYELFLNLYSFNDLSNNNVLIKSISLLFLCGEYSSDNSSYIDHNINLLRKELSNFQFNNKIYD